VELVDREERVDGEEEAETVPEREVEEVSAGKYIFTNIVFQFFSFKEMGDREVS
jgi:hypothetical protein